MHVGLLRQIEQYFIVKSGANNGFCRYTAAINGLLLSLLTNSGRLVDVCEPALLNC